MAKRIDNVVWFRDSAVVTHPEERNIADAIDYANIKFTKHFDRVNGDFWFDGKKDADFLHHPVICNNGMGIACGLYIPFNISEDGLDWTLNLLGEVKNGTRSFDELQIFDKGE